MRSLEFMHGILVAYSTLTFAKRDKFLRRLGVPAVPLSIGRALATFSIVTLTFVLFRASGVNDALWIYGAILGGKSAAVTLLLGACIADRRAGPRRCIGRPKALT